MQFVWLTDTVTSDLDRALHYTLLWGLEGLELHTMGSASDRVPHVDEEKLIRRLDEHELPLVAVTPGLFQGRPGNRPLWLNELQLLEEVLSFCQRVDCPRVIVSAFAEAGAGAVEALRRAEEQATEYDVTLAVLNEYGAEHATGQALAALLEEVGRDAVRAAWHPAQAVRAGEHPDEGAEALSGHVDIVRCSDGILRGGVWEERPVGSGAVGWEQHLRRLAENGFDGPVSLEVNVDPHAEQGVRAVRRLIRLRRSL